MNKLHHHLESNGIARRDFAELIGVDQSVLSRFCRGLARPGLEKAVAIERATGGAVPASYWVDGASAAPATGPTLGDEAAA